MQPTDKPSFFRMNARGLIVAAVLATILIVVLAVQFSGGAATAARHGGQAEAENQDPQPSDTPARKTGNPARAKDASGPWLPVALERAIGHDPFRKPDLSAADEPSAPETQDEAEEEEEATEEDGAELRRQIEAARQTALAALTEQGVGAFMSGGRDGSVAVIGDRTVRAGDVIDGFRVVSIGPDGMIVEPVD